jgi:hypothetical protein
MASIPPLLTELQTTSSTCLRCEYWYERRPYKIDLAACGLPNNTQQGRLGELNLALIPLSRVAYLMRALQSHPAQDATMAD